MTTECVQRRIDRLSDQVEEPADQENWEAVRSVSRQGLALDPENTDAITFSAAAARSLIDPGAVPSTGDPAPHVTRRVESKSTAIPTSFANGRYQVRDFLGEGGKKRVYRAHDSVLDRDVALAVIKNRGAGPDLPSPNHPRGPGHGETG